MNVDTAVLNKIEANVKIILNLWCLSIICTFLIDTKTIME